MIDIHTHLLPGVDDGSPTAEHSLMVIARLAAEGVRGIVCTPHLNASRAREAPVAVHHALLADLRASAPAEVTLHHGWEIMLDTPGVDLSAPELALGDSRARLVEFPRRALPANATSELIRLKASGTVPVVAHPERYIGLTIDTIDMWREIGVVIQVDAMALLGGGPMKDLAREMLSRGMIDVLASDNHGDRRTLTIAREWLLELGAREQAALLTEANPRALLADQALRPAPPVSFKTGVFAQLKALLFGATRTRNRGEEPT